VRGCSPGLFPARPQGAQIAAADLEQGVERTLVERDAGGAGDGAAVGDVLRELATRATRRR